MPFWKRKQPDTGKKNTKEYPVIEADLQDIRKAIRKFAENTPEGIHLSVLVKDDNTIDAQLLAPHLSGIPDKPFYMSKTTYEIFDSTEKHIPVLTDIVQQAVDAYYDETNELPYIEGDPYRKVSYYKLQRLGLLKEKPPIDFYITSQEFMVTHRKPA